jgi:Protein of unknown function (DUF4038)/Putative collagen-binding domain of a collagenase
MGIPGQAAGGDAPFRISENHRYLVDAQGKPFLVQGDAAWSLIANTTKEDVLRYLENRQAKGFNTIVVNLLERRYAAKAPSNLAGEAPFADWHDWTTPNEQYFAYADWVLQQAADHGMTVLLAPAYLGYEGREDGPDGFYDEIMANGPEKCLAYGRFLGRRYRDFDNLIWVMGGDRNPGASRANVDMIAYGIREEDHRHLFTAHCHSDVYPEDQYPTSTWLDIGASYCYQIVPLQLIWHYGVKPVRPRFLLESVYEGPSQFATPLQMRRQAYWSVLCGGFGHVMGNFPIWLFDPGWPEAMDSPGAEGMVHWGRLFRSRPWFNLVPDQDHTVVTAGLDERWGLDCCVAAATADGSTIIAYMTSARTITIDLAKMSAGQARAWWFNPRDGAATAAGMFATDGTMDFTPPGEGDWALVLDDASANLPAPGQ